MSWNFLKPGLVIASALLVLSDTGLLLAQESFRGKVIRIVIGLAPGGGFDIYSRTIAKHMGKYIPGNPAIVVENMTGGVNEGFFQDCLVAEKSKPELGTWSNVKDRESTLLLNCLKKT